MSDEIYIEYTITEDGDPSPTVLYRGPDREHAYRLFNDYEVKHPGWGINMTSRITGPVVHMGCKR